MNKAASAPRAARLPVLYLITDAERVGVERLLEAASAAVSAGLRWIQVREPSWEPDRIRALVARLRERFGRELQSGLRLVLGRRPELARELALDGVHVGGGRIHGVSEARKLLGPEAIVGYSAHSQSEVSAAAASGADYVSLSPIFGALSKSHPLPPLGIDGLRRACQSSRTPIYALGGITPASAFDLRKAGAAGAAMIGSIIDAPDAGGAVREFHEGWENLEPDADLESPGGQERNARDDS